MKIADSRLKKTVIIVISSMIIIIVVAIIFVSPIAKYLIEKYDVKYTGREIKTGWVYVNPFTGYIHISNLKIYELKNSPYSKGGDSVFFSANGVSANFAMHKLLSKTIEITELTVDRPKAIIILNKKDYNYYDLIKKSEQDKSDTTLSKYHYNILSIKIKDGTFHYREMVDPINYFVKEVNLESAGKYWNVDDMAVKFSFLSGIGQGSAQGNLIINLKNLNYRLSTYIHHYDLSSFEQYLKYILNFGNFRANFDANIQASGNLNDPENLNAKGRLAINDFHFGKSPKEDYASFDKFVLKIDQLSPKNHKYLFDSVLLSRPFYKYENYDYLNNIETMFGKNGANISSAHINNDRFNLILEIARYIKILASNFLKSDYKINHLRINKGDAIFNDFSLSEKFSIEADPFNIVADFFNKDNKRVKISLKSGIKPYGSLSVNLSINPKDSSDFDMQYAFQKVPVSMFNPYLLTRTSFPLDRGTIKLTGKWNVRNGNIKSDNHLLVIDPRINNRLRNKNFKWIPLPLIMFFIREEGNVINYEIPITGNLKNSKFHLHDVLIDLIQNVFIKPVTTPYRIEVKTIENEIEKSLSLRWDMRKSSLLENQERFIDKMADFLKDNPIASISVYPQLYTEKEKEYILFFEAKKKYFLLSQNKKVSAFSEEDSLSVDKMSVKDSLFIHFLNKKVGKTMLFTVQAKCVKFIGSSMVDAKFQKLNADRKHTFMSNFKDKALENRVKIYTGRNTVPYNGFSFYKIAYKGELPKSLTRAYEKMNELNNVAPRKKFKKERAKSKSLL